MAMFNSYVSLPEGNTSNVPIHPGVWHTRRLGVHDFMRSEKACCGEGISRRPKLLLVVEISAVPVGNHDVLVI